jgi:hypothetical protein
VVLKVKSYTLPTARAETLLVDIDALVTGDFRNNRRATLIMGHNVS